MDNLAVFGNFFTIALNNNNVAIDKTCDYKLWHGNNSRIWERKCIAAHYPFLVLDRCLI